MSSRRIVLVIVPVMSWAVLTAFLVALGRPVGPAALTALIPAGCYGAGTALADRTIRGGTVRTERLQTAAWTGWGASAVAVVLDAVGVPYSPLIGLLLAGPAWFWFARTSADGVAIGMQAPRLPESLEDGHRQVEACRRQLRNRRMTPQRRAWVKFNLVTALTQTAGMSQNARGLLEAITVLEELLADPVLAVDQKYLVASELSDTLSMTASLGGDAESWPQALDRQLAIAREQPAGTERQAALMSAHDARAQLHVFLMSRVEPDADGNRPPEFTRQVEAALACVDEALAAAPEGSGMIGHLRMERGMFLLNLDPDEGIEVLRQAHEETRRRPMVEHENIQLSYAMGLEQHAQFAYSRGRDEAGVRAALDEAAALAREVAAHGRIVGGQAAEVLAEIDRVRAGLGAEVDLRHQYRQAYERLRGTMVNDASRVAGSWADWAAEQATADERFTDEAADAYEALVREFAVEVARRTDPEEIRRHTASMQGVAAEAGYWLARAGRVAEAVAAVESARALLLTARVTRLPPDLSTRLRAAGRDDLLHRLVVAEQALDREERVQYEELPLRTAASPVAASDLRAWLAFRAVHQEIDELLGPGAPAGRPFTWDPGLGRLVYLAAARHGGYALVVDDAGPRAVPLPQLTADRARSEVEFFRRLIDAEPDGDAWEALLRRLGSSVMGPVVDDLPAGADVVLVPLGGLVLLPLHAAHTDHGYLDEWISVRYAPNARLLTEAGREVSAGPPRTALVAGAPRPAGAELAELRHAEREARWVSERFADAELLEQAELDAVRERLGRNDVWHFACHGIADPAEPLDSALLFTDAPLRLRHLLAREQGRHRLAVLSACRTTMPDASRFDETVGFPGALLKAGCAGVLATQWNIEDAAAALVVRRFYDLWLSGSAPHVALTDAQRWLRGATLADTARALPRPGIDPPEGTPTGRWARKPFADKPWAWAAFTYTGA